MPEDLFIWKPIYAKEIAFGIVVQNPQPGAVKSGSALPVGRESVPPWTGVGKEDGLIPGKQAAPGSGFKPWMAKGRVKQGQEFPIWIKQEGLLSARIDDEQSSIGSHVKVPYCCYQQATRMHCIRVGKCNSPQLLEMCQLDGNSGLGTCGAHVCEVQDQRTGAEHKVLAPMPKDLVHGWTRPNWARRHYLRDYSH